MGMNPIDGNISMCTSKPAPKAKKIVIPRGCASDQFPGKLFDLLKHCEKEGMTDVISWVGEGTAIMVHDSDRLLTLLPQFRLSQTKFRSFQRQLNMWHWERIVTGPLKGAWIHPYFRKDNKELCTYMSRHVPPSGQLPHQGQGPSDSNDAYEYRKAKAAVTPSDMDPLPLTSMPLGFYQEGSQCIADSNPDFDPIFAKGFLFDSYYHHSGRWHHAEIPFEQQPQRVSKDNEVPRSAYDYTRSNSNTKHAITPSSAKVPIVDLLEPTPIRESTILSVLGSLDPQQSKTRPRHPLQNYQEQEQGNEHPSLPTQQPPFFSESLSAMDSLIDELF